MCVIRFSSSYDYFLSISDFIVVVTNFALIKFFVKKLFFFDVKRGKIRIKLKIAEEEHKKEIILLPLPLFYGIDVVCLIL